MTRTLGVLLYLSLTLLAFVPVVAVPVALCVLPYDRWPTVALFIPPALSLGWWLNEVALKVGKLVIGGDK